MILTPLEWTLGALAAVLTGFSKTGIPGAGILVVPLMASIFGGRPSVGTLLPMLIFADCFAIWRYHAHADWKQLLKLAPAVVLGMIFGTWLLFKTGDRSTSADSLNRFIGILVLLMLCVHLARQKWGNLLAPHTRSGIYATGAAGGFSTTVSNAAGPIMTIYFQALGMDKNRFMGTFAWFFFMVNCSKVPVFLALGSIQGQQTMITPSTFLFDLTMLPFIAAGAFGGFWLLPKIPQRAFDNMLLALAAIAALKLVF